MFIVFCHVHNSILILAPLSVRIALKMVYEMHDVGTLGNRFLAKDFFEVVHQSLKRYLLRVESPNIANQA